MKITNRLCAKIISRAMKHIAKEGNDVRLFYNTPYNKYHISLLGEWCLAARTQEEFENELVRLLEE